MNDSVNWTGLNWANATADDETTSWAVFHIAEDGTPLCETRIVCTRAELERYEAMPNHVILPIVQLTPPTTKAQ